MLWYLFALNIHSRSSESSVWDRSVFRILAFNQLVWYQQFSDIYRKDADTLLSSWCCFHWAWKGTERVAMDENHLTSKRSDSTWLILRGSPLLKLHSTHSHSHCSGCLTGVTHLVQERMRTPNSAKFPVLGWLVQELQVPAAVNVCVTVTHFDMLLQDAPCLWTNASWQFAGNSHSVQYQKPSDNI